MPRGALIVAMATALGVGPLGCGSDKENGGVPAWSADDLSPHHRRLRDLYLRDYKVFLREGGQPDVHVVATSGDTGARDRSVVLLRRDGRSGGYETLDVGQKLRDAGHGGNDFAEPWIEHVPSTAESWLGATCGNVNKVCLVRSRDGGRMWDFGSAAVLGAGGLQTTHEVTVRCRDSADCLAVWMDFLNPATGDTLFAHWNGSALCAGSLLRSAPRGVPHSFLPGDGPRRYELFVNELDAKQGTAATDRLELTIGDGCAPVLGQPVRLLDPATRSSRLEEKGIFRHEGAGIDVERAPNGKARWVVVPETTAAPVHRLVAARSADGGGTWTLQKLEPPAGTHLVSPSLAFDAAKAVLYLFYLRVDDEGSFTASTYSVCYRTAAAEGSTPWPDVETCPPPLRGLRGKTGTDGKPFGNNLFVGSVHDGRIAIVYQDRCEGGVCSLFLARNF